MLCLTVHLKGGPNRDDHAAVAIGDKVYSFGGYWENKVHIEVHIFNTVSLRWTVLPPVITGEVPSIRWGHSVVLIDDSVYICGGWTNKWELYDILYAFDVYTHGWSKPKVSGTVPGARYNHSACVLGKAMCIYGGYTKLSGYINVIYKLDTDTMVWSLVDTRGTPPPALQCHSSTLIGTKLFVFKGQWFNNFTVFDTETNCWLSTEPSAQLLEEGRWRHSAFAYNGEMYICGGRNCADLWKFNPGTFKWKRIVPKGKRLVGRMYWMCCCMVGERIILYGGDTPDNLYILDLSPSLKTLCKLAVLRYSLEDSGLPHDIRWELATMAGNSTRKNDSATKPTQKKDNNSREQVPANGTEQRESPGDCRP